MGSGATGMPGLTPMGRHRMESKTVFMARPACVVHVDWGGEVPPASARGAFEETAPRANREASNRWVECSASTPTLRTPPRECRGRGRRGESHDHRDARTRAKAERPSSTRSTRRPTARSGLDVGALAMTHLRVVDASSQPGFERRVGLSTSPELQAFVHLAKPPLDVSTMFSCVHCRPTVV